MTTEVKHRSRNAVATRQAILDAARLRFMAHSYEDVGMRDVARDVGVDAALVSRYFGGKEELFLEVLDSCKNKRNMMEGDRTCFGERVAREIILGPSAAEEDGNGFSGLLILLRSIGSTKAMDIVQSTSNANFFQPLTLWLGGKHAAGRARLVAGMIMGVAISREMSDGYAEVDTVDREAMVQRFAAILQAEVDAG
ncbi:TetR family transcriptional regulator [Brevundimonas sp.]|uniref:TetR family transcriptional regulator n=1 Tax=Brevundimonas sp. TaxID=1871086 RepID=UPI002FC7739F